ncbi:hypothetical protein BKA93DRAFT_816902 [Sparassis latifolia]
METIPALLHQHLQLLHDSASLRNPAHLQSAQCSCGGVSVRSLKVVCVFFECEFADLLHSGLETISLDICLCSPAALQLLSRGLFSCMPQAPTLAVDLNLLQFVQQLFVCLPPNTTSFCATLEAFLGDCNYKLQMRDTLRRRFGNALLWYSSLVNSTRRFIQDKIENARASTLHASTSRHEFRQELPTPQYFPGDVEGCNSAEESDAVEESDSYVGHSTEAHPRVHMPPLPGLDSPDHRPACGSPSPSLVSDAAAAADDIDCLHGESLPHASSPVMRSRPSQYLQDRCPLCFRGSFSEQTEDMLDIIVCLDACFTQKCRRGRGDERDWPRAHPDTVFVPEDDVKAMENYVKGLRGPRDYTHRTSKKKSTDEEDGFKGGMKILTSVLDGCNESFLAADEKRQKASTQFFADTDLMALLCVKWGFLSDVIDYIIFSISIFHAYGHQWPCQLIYHPQKCVGFGLTEGEGCERFWSAIRKLIPSLRVSGYHQQLFTLDTQVRHLDDVSLHALGHWIVKKWDQCQSKKHTAFEELAQCGVPTEILRAQWNAQIVEQTKPAPRHSRNKGKHAVEAILALQKARDLYKETLHELEIKLLADSDVPFSIDKLNLQIAEARSKCQNIEQAITRKKATLGIAIKQRIRDRLCQWKFELERLEHSYCQTLTTHTESSIKRCEPGILRLVKTYNDLCKQLNTMIRQRKAPRHAIALLPIQGTGLFKLDVDDDIWEDVGLEDDDMDTVPVPPWLGDEKEELRLHKERCGMQEWIVEEWVVLEKAHVNASE